MSSSYLAGIEALQACARDLGRTPGAYSYMRWRTRQRFPSDFPAVSTIHLMIGPWDQALRAAGLTQEHQE